MATNKVYCSYQEIIDLHTEPDKVTAIGIHTPVDDTPKKMFEGFYRQFKKFKYIGASVSLIPVATLPVDPLQVEYVGNDGIDPRDVMNPVLFHGCHGEDMGTVLNMLMGRDMAISDSLIGMIGSNADGAPTSEQLLYSLLDELYYKALTDNTWRKAHPQRGFKKSGLRPLLYSLATNRQIAPGNLSDVLGFNDDDDVTAFGGDPTIADRTIINPVTGQEITVPTYATKNNLQIMTPRLTRLGYLDTRNVVTDFTPGVASVDTMVTSENWTSLPKLMMGLILLPPSYKVEMHFRMIINHYWCFKGFRGISFRNDLLKSPSYFNANEDLFANESGNGNPIPEEIGGDTPEPEPEPEPIVDTSNVYLQIIASSSSQIENTGIYALEYTLNGLTTLLATEPEPERTVGTFKIYGPFTVPVGATLGGTYVRQDSTLGPVYGAISGTNPPSGWSEISLPFDGSNVRVPFVNGSNAIAEADKDRVVGRSFLGYTPS